MPARAHSNNNKKDEKTPLDSPGKESWARRCRATMPSKLCVARTQYNTHPWPSLSNLTQPAGAKKKRKEKLLAPNGNQSKLKQESISVLFRGCSRIKIESAGCNNRERWTAKLKTSDGFQKQSSQIWKNDGGFARDGPTLSPVHPQ
jgi:hypothetical protein